MLSRELGFTGRYDKASVRFLGISKDTCFINNMLLWLVKIGLFCFILRVKDYSFSCFYAL